MQLNKSSVFNPGGAAMHYQLMYSWDIFDTMVSELCLAARSRMLIAVFLMNVYCLYRIFGFWLFEQNIWAVWWHIYGSYWLLYDSRGDTCSALKYQAQPTGLFGSFCLVIKHRFGTSWFCFSCQSHVHWSHMVSLQITPWGAQKQPSVWY